MHLVSAKQLIFFLFSVPFALLDRKYRAVPGGFFLGQAAVGLFFCLLEKRSLLSLLCAFLPGLLLWALSMLTEHGIGTGDALYFGSAAFFFPCREVFLILIPSLFLAFFAALISLGKKEKNLLPFLAFVPFSLFLLGLTGLQKGSLCFGKFLPILP